MMLFRERLAGHGISNDDRLTVAGNRLRKVAIPLGFRRNANVHRSQLGHELIVVLLVDEEEELVLADPGHGPTEIPAIKVVAIQRARDVSSVVEEIVGVQTVMPAEIAPRAMVLIRTRTRRECDKATARPAILRLIV